MPVTLLPAPPDSKCYLHLWSWVDFCWWKWRQCAQWVQINSEALFSRNCSRYFRKTLLKDRQSQNDFIKPKFLPKNERRNSTLLLWYLRSTCYCSFFWKKFKIPKRHFETNWPLQSMFLYLVWLVLRYLMTPISKENRWVWMTGSFNEITNLAGKHCKCAINSDKNDQS